MNRKQAIRKVWDLLNKNKYTEANVLMREQRKIHGNRLFNYWMRLCILNGLWEISLNMWREKSEQSPD